MSVNSENNTPVTNIQNCYVFIKEENDNYVNSADNSTIMEQNFSRPIKQEDNVEIPVIMNQQNVFSIDVIKQELDTQEPITVKTEAITQRSLLWEVKEEPLNVDPYAVTNNMILPSIDQAQPTEDVEPENKYRIYEIIKCESDFSSVGATFNVLPQEKKFVVPVEIQETHLEIPMQSQQHNAISIKEEYCKNSIVNPNGKKVVRKSNPQKCIQIRQSNLPKKEIVNNSFKKEKICNKFNLKQPSSGISEDKTMKGIKPFSCDICNRKFTQKGHLNVHLRTHSGEKPFSCVICKRNFTERGTLKKHLSTHASENSHVCEVCNCRFTDMEQLKIHLRSHFQPYSCDVCKESFYRKGVLKMHLKTHRNMKPYSCDVCQRNFSEKRSLKRHLTTHTGVKPYSCNICNHSFWEKCHLKSHLRTHTGEKPYSCDICARSFNEKGGLKIHLRTHTGDKPFSCDICQRKFTEKGSLRSHIKLHEGCKPYPCDVCKKTFSRKGNLKIHLRIHSGENSENTK